MGVKTVCACKHVSDPPTMSNWLDVCF